MNTAVKKSVVELLRDLAKGAVVAASKSNRQQPAQNPQAPAKPAPCGKPCGGK